MNVIILRIRKNQKKKDFYFESVSDAALFESTFFKYIEAKDLQREILTKDIIESKKLLHELSYEPESYAEREFLRWFYPEQIQIRKKLGEN